MRNQDLAEMDALLEIEGFGGYYEFLDSLQTVAHDIAALKMEGEDLQDMNVKIESTRSLYQTTIILIQLINI